MTNMIVDYINTHHAQFWFFVGFVLLAMEAITGLTVGIFLFGGLGALLTGLLMIAGVIPQSWLAGVACLGVSSGMITALLWKPLRLLQGERTVEKDNSSDFIGYEFIADQSISTGNPGSIRYSGIEWQVIIDKEAGVNEIEAGQFVKVTSIDVGKFYVTPV